ncbi:sensor histidine kinase [Devosia sp. MC532]|uniref:sensor histidine kinase n=1 Tax=Devosia sp. MC532 TaxID=2799788 RepID=UPI0018F6E82F|nr:ATP-binding protein [Devosia sp. MC532]MBJ7576846.1 sensor histidine kinase [Devosia sp. MC532]
MDFSLKRMVRGPLLQWAFLGAVLLALSGVALTVGAYVGEAEADAEVLERGDATTQLQVSALLAELDKQRAVRFLVARDADVIATLNDGQPLAVAGLNQKLRTLAEGAGASVIYVINVAGDTIAASNFDTDESFVGNNYQYRAYFRDAMSGGTGQLFAMGATSRVPGLYVSERIEGPEGTLGVAVVKIDFRLLETLWAPGNAATYVTDARDVVLLSSVPTWQFYAAETKSAAEVAGLRQSLQYLSAPLRPLPIASHEGRTDVVEALIPPNETPHQFARVQIAVPTTDWQLSALFPVEAERAAAITTTRSNALLVLAAGAALAALALALLQRSDRVRRRMADQHHALELAVETRTADLAATNHALMEVITERDAAELNAARLRDELTQANRLASLGQIAAGVAHEINQPLGAIRAYADNGQVFLQRSANAEALENFGAISRLTDRITKITEHLRDFSRKGGRNAVMMDLRSAVDAALSLLGANIRHQNVRIDYTRPQTDVPIFADETGVEQIIVNLIQNALEALEGRADKAISIAFSSEPGSVNLRVTDNGPGVSPDMAERIFTPFSTSKAKGLGLGLVISQDLAQSFGASLLLDPKTASGASFVLRFPRPTP